MESNENVEVKTQQTETIEANQGEEIENVDEVLGTEEELEDEANKSDNETEETKTEETKKDKPKQTADERKKFAEMRRARQAKEREEAENKGYQKGIVEGLGGTNPYTNEKITDDYDFKLYQEMKECEQKGYDPTKLSDLTKFRKEKMQEDFTKAQEQNTAKEKSMNDIKDFQKKYSDVNVNDLLTNESFVKLYGDLIGLKPLATLYENFLSIDSLATEKAKQIALKEKARRESTTGSLSEEAQINDTYSAEELSKLSRKEIEDNWDKVNRSMNMKK